VLPAADGRHPGLAVRRGRADERALCHDGQHARGEGAVDDDSGEDRAGLCAAAGWAEGAGAEDDGGSAEGAAASFCGVC
jgi:hypothetical protein